MGKENDDYSLEGDFFWRSYTGETAAQSVQMNLDKAGRALDSGDIGATQNLLRGMGSSILVAIRNGTSPRLTDEENKEYLRLKALRFRGVSGMIFIAPLHHAEEAKLNKLCAKAYGKTEA